MFNRSTRRLHLIGAAIIAPALLLGACAEDDDDASGTSAAQKFDVSLTKEGCSPATINAKTGPATFVVTNKGASAVTEFEVLDGNRIVGEVENVIEGLKNSFTINLKAGEYTTYCPGGTKTERGKLVVKGTDATPAAGTDPDLEAAVTTYRAFVTNQSEALVKAVEQLKKDIDKGDVEAAKASYIAARPYYERVEPVAEAFGDLDPAIDARADDVEPEELTGFHRIEYGLWEKNSTDGLKDVADQLVKDCTRLRDDGPKLDIDALQVANGANELLSEVSQSKVTGEEERYSHIDLVDFQANVEGSRAAFNAIRAALAVREPELATTIDQRFEDVTAALAPYKTGDTYKLYTDLTEDDTKKLSQAIDALAEPLSQAAAALTKPAAS